MAALMARPPIERPPATISPGEVTRRLGTRGKALRIARELSQDGQFLMVDRSLSTRAWVGGVSRRHRIDLHAYFWLKNAGFIAHQQTVYGIERWALTAIGHQALANVVAPDQEPEQ